MSEFATKLPCGLTMVHDSPTEESLRNEIKQLESKQKELSKQLDALREKNKKTKINILHAFGNNNSTHSGWVDPEDRVSVLRIDHFEESIHVGKIKTEFLRAGDWIVSYDGRTAWKVLSIETRKF